MDNIENFEDFLNKMQGLLDNAKKQGNNNVRLEDLESTFPELKERDGEKIKGAIIHFISHTPTVPKGMIDKETMISWLEKQGQVKDSVISQQENKTCKKIIDVLTCEEKKIKEDLIQWFNDFPDTIWRGHYKKDVIAWLEKQGQEKHSPEPIKDYQESFACWNNAHDFRPKHLQRCICYDKYMKGVYCYVYDNISKYWCTQTTDEHDPDGDNHICDYADYRVTIWMPLPITSFYSSNTSLEKQNKKKPADNKEPKFEVGKWVVNKLGDSWHIVNFDKKKYQISNRKGNYNYFPISKQDEMHLWSINDANDGDVLVCESKEYLLFKSFSNNDGRIKLYCWYNDQTSNFHLGGVDTKLRKEAFICPATKEQQDTFFAKMKEAGYKWYSDTKELIEIVQKPADKPEHKFKVGHWIVQENIGVYKIIEICESWYEVVDAKDKHYSISFDKEHMCHLWSIADAKNGDVLVDEDNNIGIYKEIESVYWNSYIYLGCDGKLRGFSIGGSHEQTDTRPATKEQRDTLEKAMADAGYTFDFEKKELKKIERKPADKSEPKSKYVQENIGDYKVINEIDHQNE